MDIQNTALHNTCIIHLTYVVIIFAQLSVACISHYFIHLQYQFNMVSGLLWPVARS